MIKVIIFDFYGVFMPDAYSAWLSKNNVRREGIFAELITKLDLGAISRTVFLQRLSAALGRTVAGNEIHSDITLDQELVDLARSLKPHYKIGLLSNASARLRSKLDTIGLGDLFDEVLISGEMGIAKPGDAIFQHAISTFDVNADEVMFIDDSLVNTDAAARNGIVAVHYTGVAPLREWLMSQELL